MITITSNSESEPRSELEQREKDLRREHFIKAAREAFAENDLQTTTMKDIAQKAGFSVGTIYRYFDGKEELFLNIFEQKNENYLKKLNSVLNQNYDHAEDFLKKLLDTTLEHWESDPEFYEIFTSGNRLNRVSLQEIAADFYETYFKKVESMCKKGVDEGWFSGDPMILANFLWGMVNSFIIIWSRRGRDFSLTSKRDEIIDIFLRGATPREQGTGNKGIGTEI